MKFMALLVVTVFSISCSSYKPGNEKMHELEHSKQLKRTCLNLLSPLNHNVTPIIANYHLKVVK